MPSFFNTPDICRGDHCSSMMSCLILHTNSGARAVLRVERLRRSTALACALNQMYLPDGVLLRLNSRESVDWLIPTIRVISFLGHFLCSKAKICDLCSEVSCLYIRNTKIINLRESSKGDSFLYYRYRSSGLRAPAARPTRGVFYKLEPMKKRMICCTSILKVRGDVLWTYYVYLGAHFKNISRMESPVSWSSSFCNASTLTAICCGNLFNSSAILIKPAGQQ